MISESLTKKILASLTGLLLVFAGVYGYFLQQTVTAVAQRGEVTREITQLRSQIGDAQQKYGTEIGAATLKRARQLGFRTVDRSRYVVRHAADSSLVTLNVTSNQ